MPEAPLPKETARDGGFEKLFESLCVRPAMYVAPVRLGSVCAFITGYNAARDGEPLFGFKEWLVVRFNGGTNFDWQGLIYEALTGGVEAESHSLEEHRRLIEQLRGLLCEFFAYRRENGLTKILDEYARCLRRRR